MHFFLSVIVSSGCFFTPNPADADDQVTKPIETGAIELREVLREAIMADVERYPFGEIECEITNQNLEGPLNVTSVQVHSWWSKDKSFTTINEKMTTDPSFIRSSRPLEGIQVRVISMEQTIDNKKFMIVGKDSNRATIALLSTRSRQPNTSVSSADFWFGKVDGEGSHWYGALGPAPTTPVNIIKQYDTRLLPGDRIEITTTYQGDRGSFRAIASLTHWKILSVDAKMKTNGKIQTFAYAYTWDENGQMLNRFVFRLKGGDRPTYERTYEVKKLDLITPPRQELFEIDETKLPAGYFIDNKITKRQYWQGNISR